MFRSLLYESLGHMNNRNLHVLILAVTCPLIILNVIIVYAASDNSALLQDKPQPNIDANSLYNSHTMILSKNVKNFVIVIPDEAHESLNQPKNQLPLTNQPYLPQHLVTNIGTTIVWFNADVGHKHKVTLSDSNSKNVYDNSFAYNQSSKPLTLNSTGNFAFLEAGLNKDIPSFTMNGSIVVMKLSSELKVSKNTSSPKEINTVGAFMVPAIYLDKYISEFAKRDLTVDSSFTYKDLRGGQKGTGPRQTLLVWTTKETNLDNIISSLKEITTTLPYS